MTGDIARRRLAAQRLLAPARLTPAGLVAALGAVQAQDYAGAKWGIGQRIAGATDALVERAMTDGSIIRTHVLRPTWHFVSPADVRWMLALTAPRIRAAMAYYDRRLEIDDTVATRANTALVRALRDGRQLTRTECAAVLATARVGATASQRLGHLMMRAELDAVVCSGPRRGKQFTYALLDERVPPAPALTRDEALAELTRRYFATRSPATVNDFAWWSGLTVSDARRGAAALGAGLGAEIINGTTYYAMNVDRPAPPRAPTAHLLPNYDEYFIGFKDRSALAGRIDDTSLVRGGDALVSHVVIVDGTLAGGWRRMATAATPAVELRLLARLTPREARAVDAAVARYEAFAGGER